MKNRKPEMPVEAWKDFIKTMELPNHAGMQLIFMAGFAGGISYIERAIEDALAPHLNPRVSKQLQSAHKSAMEEILKSNKDREEEDSPPWEEEVQ